MRRSKTAHEDWKQFLVVFMDEDDSGASSSTRRTSRSELVDKNTSETRGLVERMRALLKKERMDEEVEIGEPTPFGLVGVYGREDVVNRLRRLPFVRHVIEDK